MSGPLNGSRKQVLKSTFFIPRHECLMDTYRRFRLLRSQFWQKCTHFNSSFCTYILFNKKIYLWLSLLIMIHLAPQKAFPLFLHYVQVCPSSLHPFLVLSLFSPSDSSYQENRKSEARKFPDKSLRHGEHLLLHCAHSSFAVRSKSPDISNMSHLCELF